MAGKQKMTRIQDKHIEIINKYAICYSRFVQEKLEEFEEEKQREEKENDSN